MSLIFTEVTGSRVEAIFSGAQGEVIEYISGARGNLRIALDEGGQVELACNEVKFLS